MASLDLIHMTVFGERLTLIMKFTKGEILVVNSKSMTSKFFSTFDVHDTYPIGKWRSIVKGIKQDKINNLKITKDFYMILEEL
jgi:hypothetical protein